MNSQVNKPSGTFDERAPLMEYMAKISKYLDKKGVTEVWINRPNEIVVQSNEGRHTFDDNNLDADYCKNLAIQIAGNSGQAINQASPILYGSIFSGERVQIVKPPATIDNQISFSFRKASDFTRTFEDYKKAGYFEGIKLTGIGKGTLSDVEKELFDLYSKGNIDEFLKKAILSFQNIVVSGSSDSGKTTFMKSLVNIIPTHERLISIENVDEIELWKTHRNSVSLMYSANKQGIANITQQDLLRSCLRMNPSRIILAELTSGEEAVSFLSSINSGHRGAITSVHANSSLAAFERLISMVGDSKSGAGKPESVIRRNLDLTIDIIIQCHKREGKNGENPIYEINDIYYKPNKKYQLLNQV